MVIAHTCGDVQIKLKEVVAQLKFKWTTTSNQDA